MQVWKILLTAQNGLTEQEVGSWWTYSAATEPVNSVVIQITYIYEILGFNLK